MNTASNGAASKTVRCAVYTRKSTEEGLNQEFNSLDAQREAAEAYIASQCHEGWLCLPTPVKVRIWGRARVYGHSAACAPERAGGARAETLRF